MNIVKKLAKWTGFERKKEITEIVIHGTGGADTLNYVLNGGRSSEYEQGIGLFHYLIGLDGVVYQLLENDRWCYHSSSGKRDETTIGIEIEKENFDNSNDLTTEQYIQLNLLISHLKSKFLASKFLTGKFSINSIVGHDYNAKKYSNRDPKPCPGFLDIQRLDFEIKL